MGTAPLDRFREETQRAAAVVHGPASAAEALEMLAVLTSQPPSCKVAICSELSRDWPELGERLASQGCTVILDGSGESLATADVGVSTAALAVAETGSVLLAGDDLASRLVSMLPLTHVVLVPVSSVVPTLEEAAAFLRRSIQQLDSGRSRHISLVTGPSRTADIERVLTIGVHGPRELHVILVAQAGAAAQANRPARRSRRSAQGET